MPNMPWDPPSPKSVSSASSFDDDRSPDYVPAATSKYSSTRSSSRQSARGRKAPSTKTAKTSNLKSSQTSSGSGSTSSASSKDGFKEKLLAGLDCDNPYEKPKLSYAQLIFRAIINTEERKMTLNSIYNWITDHFAYFRHCEGGWQNSVRHNLSTNKCFIKVPRPKEVEGKGSFWTIDPSYIDIFMASLNSNEKPGRVGNLKRQRSSNAVPAHRNNLPRPNKVQRTSSTSSVTSSLSSASSVVSHNTPAESISRSKSEAQQQSSPLQAGQPTPSPRKPKPSLSIKLNLQQLPTGTTNSPVLPHPPRSSSCTPTEGYINVVDIKEEQTHPVMIDVGHGHPPTPADTEDEFDPSDIDTETDFVSVTGSTTGSCFSDGRLSSCSRKYSRSVSQEQVDIYSEYTHFERYESSSSEIYSQRLHVDGESLGSRGSVERLDVGQWSGYVFGFEERTENDYANALKSTLPVFMGCGLGLDDIHYGLNFVNVQPVPSHFMDV